MNDTHTHKINNMTVNPLAWKTHYCATVKYQNDENAHCMFQCLYGFIKHVLPKDNTSGKGSSGNGL